MSPGEKLPSEKILAQEFQVSRTSLREAFKKLEQMGTITIKQGDGTYLNGTSQLLDNHMQEMLQFFFTVGEDNLMDYLEVREMIEAKAAALAAKRAQKEDIEKMTAILKQGESTETSEFSKADLEFHRLVVYSAHNIFLSQIWEILAPLIAEQLDKSHFISGVTSNANDTHKQLLDAIVHRRSRNAEKIMIEHLSIVPGRFLSEATRRVTERKNSTIG